jgi:lysophospholipase L1-like esterase
MLGGGWQVMDVGTSQQKATEAAPGVKGLIAARRPSVLMIMYGYNDFDAGTSAETVAATLLGMADDARALGTYPIVALLPTCGMTFTWMNPHIQRLNDLLRAQAAGRCGLADVAGEFGDWQASLQPDGAHFSPEGAGLAAAAFLDAL